MSFSCFSTVQVYFKLQHKMRFILLTIFLAIASVTAYENSDIVSARIETCRGCSLNRLPEVKKFVMEDAPTYDRLEVKFITGAPPELVLLGAGDTELERLPLSALSRDECNQILHSRDFTKQIKRSKSEF